MLVRGLTVLGLQAFAVLLAMIQATGSVRTDEAKYLLNIPYPHPPLLRTIMGWTDGWSYQEMFWRIVIATVVLQAVWIVADMGRRLRPERRLALCGLWVFSGGVLLQAGQIFMAPVTAVQALVFCWLLLRREHADRAGAAGVGFLWLASLFTAYQAALFAPIVAVLLWRLPSSHSRAIVALCAPVLLLALYSLTNPLALASMGLAGSQNAALSAEVTITGVVRLWITGGSLVLSVLGTWGMLRARSLPLLAAFALVVAYLALSLRPYYAVLFAPLLIAGLAAHPRLLRASAFVLAAQIVVGVYLFIHAFPSAPSPARAVMQRIVADLGQVPGSGDLLIAGVFGHEWQYESPLPVRRFREDLLDIAGAVVCLEPCGNMPQGWRRVDGAAAAWIRAGDPK